MISILEHLQCRISEIKEILYVDENWGQLDYYDTRPPAKWPCALITINDGTFSSIGGNMQQGVITLDIAVADLKLTNTSFKSPNKPWGIWNIVEKIHKKLHGWRPSATSGNLIRSSLRITRRDDGIQEIHIIYTLGLNNV